VFGKSEESRDPVSLPRNSILITEWRPKAADATQ
jgi:hypothetical protein